MEYIAVTVNGIEEVASLEIKELIKATATKITAGRVKFKATEAKVKELIYQARSINRVYALHASFRFKALNDIVKNCPDIKISPPFKARCVREGTHNFSSKDVVEKIGEKFFKKGNEVDLEDPKTIIYIEIIDSLCLIGIDITKKDLQKRDYRVKLHNQSPNALVAYAMVRIAGWNKDEILLDPFCKDGVILIEAASYASKIPRGFFTGDKIEAIDKAIKKDKLKLTGYDSLLHNVRSCEINSKLADVNKLVKFSKIDIDWLDVKFEEATVDKIVSTPPFVSRDKPSVDVEKLYKHLFHHARFILKKEGRMVLLIHRKDLIAKYSEGFKLDKELKTIIGGMELNIQVYSKK